LRFYFDRRAIDETHHYGQQAEDAEHVEDGRLRRVPGFLPVRVQDVLHGRQPGLREIIIAVKPSLIGKAFLCGCLRYFIKENE
jgi:hypothetical protein